MNHSYWNSLLRIPKHGVNKYLAEITKRPVKKQHQFLAFVIDGFFPISYSTPMAFRRVSELAAEPNVKLIAKHLYELELGRHPFIKGNKHQDVLHCIQFKKTIESLVRGTNFDKPHPSQYNLLKKLDLENATLVKALAICDVIEHHAPEIIICFQDFVAQWQFLTNRGSSEIDRIYLDEHSLTEGGESEDQHVKLVENMKASYSGITESAEYEEMRDLYNQICFEHIDIVFSKIISIFQNEKSSVILN